MPENKVEQMSKEIQQLRAKIREQKQIIQDLQDQLSWLRKAFKEVGVRGL